jgi:mono/diheme cytochrome c family protein
MTLLRRFAKWLGIAILALLVVVAAMVGWAWAKVTRTTPLARTSLHRATSPEDVARGERIFRNVCATCHVPPGDTRPIGRAMTEYPQALGNFHSANLTQDARAGIGRWRDEDVARVLRTAVRPDGHFAIGMPPFDALADEDVAAVIGFLRSPSPDLAPAGRRAPRSRPNVLGATVMYWVAGIGANEAPGRVPRPPEGPTAEYGRYMAVVYDCVGCHTEGLKTSSEQIGREEAYTGGHEFPVEGGPPIVSPNITPDPSGLGRYAFEEFQRALREGIDRDGLTLRPPMPVYRYLPDFEARAIWEHLRTVRPRNLPRPEGARRRRPAPGAPPDRLFVDAGCVSCHGPGRPFESKLRGARGKAPADVAAWIRNPERFRPGTQMPTFASVIPEADALHLAEWIQRR